MHVCVCVRACMRACVRACACILENTCVWGNNNTFKFRLQKVVHAGTTDVGPTFTVVY